MALLCLLYMLYLLSLLLAPGRPSLSAALYSIQPGIFPLSILTELRVLNPDCCAYSSGTCSLYLSRGGFFPRSSLLNLCQSWSTVSSVDVASVPAERKGDQCLRCFGQGHWLCLSGLCGFKPRAALSVAGGRSPKDLLTQASQQLQHLALDPFWKFVAYRDEAVLLCSSHVTSLNVAHSKSMNIHTTLLHRGWALHCGFESHATV